jgi:hypothetical protein
MHMLFSHAKSKPVPVLIKHHPLKTNGGGSISIFLTLVLDGGE